MENLITILVYGFLGILACSLIVKMFYRSYFRRRKCPKCGKVGTLEKYQDVPGGEEQEGGPIGHIMNVIQCKACSEIISVEPTGRKRVGAPGADRR